MKLTEGYVLRSIHGTHYLLPIGQNIALHKRGLKLNDTSLLLWSALAEGLDEKELLPLLIQHYEVDTSSIPALQSDIDFFIQQLASLNLLSQVDDSLTCNNYFKIGDIVIGYHGPQSLVFPSLMDFSCKEAVVDQYWLIESYPPATLPMGEVLIRTNDIEICKSKDNYIISFFPSSQLLRVKISLNGTHARFYCAPLYNDALAEKLFYAFRFAFIVYAQQKGLFMLHSASIYYQNKAWLFSAPSGTGKSTHAGFWKDLYKTPILNGDLNLISIQHSQPLVWGTPWCGSSQIYTTGSYTLGGIILLKQHSENMLQELTIDEQQLILMQRFISPTWTEEMMDYCLDFSGKLVELILVLRLLCTNEPSAVHVMKQFIDKTIKEKDGLSCVEL